MAQSNRASSTRSGTSRRPARQKPGVKREQILDVAIDYFGRYGYEDTKWADVAAAVDIGSTALYHYFESKQHCLYEIMVEAVTDFRERFVRITADEKIWTDAVVAVIVDSYDLSDREIMRNRVLVSEFGRVGILRTSPREEAARSAARSRTRDLEYAWGTFLARGMQQGLLPEGDPRLLTRAVLGLYTSIFHWYRLDGELTIADVGRFYAGRQLAILGVSPKLAAEKFPLAA